MFPALGSVSRCCIGLAGCDDDAVLTWPGGCDMGGVGCLGALKDCAACYKFRFVYRIVEL